MRKYRFLLAAIVLAGCHSYEMKAPVGFDAEPVAVSGKLGALKIGDYQLSKVERSWTDGSGVQVMAVRSEKRKQKYRFHVARTDTAAADVQCEFVSRERAIGLRSGWDLIAGGGAKLNCDLKRGVLNYVLDVSTQSTDVLSGKYQAAKTYRIVGVGTTAFTAGRKGPAAGFHIFDGDRLVALVQIIGPRRLMLARGTDETERSELIPAAAALLLLDESIADF